MIWKPTPSGSEFGLTNKGQPVELVVALKDDGIADDAADADEQREVAQRRAGDEEQRAGRDEDDDRGAHVGLGDDETADDAKKQDERHEAERELVDLLPAAGQPGGDVDDDRQLGELARLYGDRAEDQPAAGAVALDTDRRAGARGSGRRTRAAASARSRRADGCSPCA